MPQDNAVQTEQTATGEFFRSMPMMAGTGELAQEIYSFGARRLHANAERLQELLRVRSPNDLIDCEMRFAAATFGDYADEAVRLQEIIHASVAETAEKNGNTDRH